MSTPTKAGTARRSRASIAILATIALLAVLAPSAGARTPRYNLLGTWTTGPLSGGSRAPADGTQTVTQMNMTTGAFSGTSVVSDVHFKLAGRESGSSVEFTQSEGSYVAHDRIPTLSVLADGHVGGDGSFEAGEFWMEVTASTAPHGPQGEGGETSKPAQRAPFVTVICNIFPSTPSTSTCTADVGDSSALARQTPTGTVTFSTSAGTFLTGETCTLTPEVGLGAVSSCTLPFQPAPGTQQGAPLPVSAHYSGDSVFASAVGGTSPVVPTLGSSVSEVSSGGSFSVSLVNPNGVSSAGSVGISSAGAAALASASARAARASLASGSFKAGRLGVTAVHLKLSSAGRSQLARKKTLHVLVRITTKLGGHTLTRSYALTLRARKH